MGRPLGFCPGCSWPSATTTIVAMMPPAACS